MKQFSFYQLMGDIELLEAVQKGPEMFPTFKKLAKSDVSGGAGRAVRSVGRGAQRVAAAPAGKVLKKGAKIGALTGAGALGVGALAGYGAYRAVKGIAKGAVNAIRYPFRPYEKEEKDEE